MVNKDYHYHIIAFIWTYSNGVAEANRKLETFHFTDNIVNSVRYDVDCYVHCCKHLKSGLNYST